ncbi:segregation/condensation protein A [bacterium]|nr:segregation/condensation protein A [bacterium]
MTYDVKTAVFEGPLELLLRLITARQVEIAEVSLTDLIAEFVGYVELAQKMDLEITSEFLVIAATLIQLKARRLLPDDGEIDLDEELALAEERDRLLTRLLASLTFKDVAAVIAHRFEGMTALVPRTVGLDPGVGPPPPELRLDITPSDLSDLATRVLERHDAEPDLDHLDLDLPSVAAAISDVRSRVASDVETDFDRLVEHLNRPVEVVAYFLALLELVRWGLVSARQDDLAAPIVITHTADAGDEFVSEWDR